MLIRRQKKKRERERERSVFIADGIIFDSFVLFVRRVLLLLKKRFAFLKYKDI